MEIMDLVLDMLTIFVCGPRELQVWNLEDRTEIKGEIYK